jgi:hypothetical protein
MMKGTPLFIVGLCSVLLLSCSKKESSPTGPENKEPEQSSIAITPGVGAAKMKLGETLGKLRQVHGNPNRHLYAHFCTGETWHHLYYDSVKAVAKNTAGSTLYTLQLGS